MKKITIWLQNTDFPKKTLGHLLNIGKPQEMQEIFRFES